MCKRFQRISIFTDNKDHLVSEIYIADIEEDIGREEVLEYREIFNTCVINMNVSVAVFVIFFVNNI